MAIIPLKQTVYVRKPISVKWGEVTWSEPIPYKKAVRVDEKTSITKNQLGDEVISTAQIIFNKLPDISYDDELTFTNEIGLIIKGNPINIEPVRSISGKPVLTLVYL